MGSQVATSRLMQERKEFRKTRPYGFVAKPASNPDGALNLFHWKCCIPGKEGTAWAKGKYPVELKFSNDYPTKAPTAAFPKGFLHPNVYPSGEICLSILNDDPDLCGNWAPSLTVGQILTGIQDLLNEPNLLSPAQDRAYKLLKTDPVKYARDVRRQAEQYAVLEGSDE